MHHHLRCNGHFQVNLVSHFPLGFFLCLFWKRVFGDKWNGFFTGQMETQSSDPNQEELLAGPHAVLIQHRTPHVRPWLETAHGRVPWRTFVSISTTILVHTAPLCTGCTRLQGTVTQVSVFGLSKNNKWQLWVWMTAQVGWLTMKVNSHLVFRLQSQNELGG